MAIAYDATGAGSATSTSCTYSHTCGASAKILVVGVNCYRGGSAVTDDVTGVTYNGTAMTYVTKVTATANQISYIYYLANPDTGSAYNVVVSKTTGSDTIRSCSASYDDAVAIGAYGTNTATSSNSVAKAVTTLNDNAWMVSFTFNDGNTCQADTGTTARNTSLTYAAIGDSGSAITPTQSYSMGWNIAAGNVNWDILNLEITDVAGVTVSPSALTLSTTSQTPEYFIDVTQGPQALTLSLQTPTVEISTVVRPSSLSLTLSLGGPTFSITTAAAHYGHYSVGTGTVGTRFVEHDYPYVEGLQAGTTKRKVYSW